MRKAIKPVMLMSLIVLAPVAYLWALNTFFTLPKAKLIPLWRDDEFLTEPQEPVWIDSNFTEGWSIDWHLGQKEGDYGFTVQNGTLDLYATFRGYNYSGGNGLSGISIKKAIPDIDREAYPYLRIEHRENSSDFGLMFSFSISNGTGQWFDGRQIHASTSWTVLECDLRELYNGTIAQISIQFTNGYDRYYAGGTEHAYIKSIGIYKRIPTWKLSCNKPIEANMTTEQGILKIFGNGPLIAGTIASAQRSTDLTFNLVVARYLNISIKTTSINVAARIVIWASPSQYVTVLLKTYNDFSWHIEIVDLLAFGINVSGLYMVELGWQQVYDSTDQSIAWYRQLSFNQLEQSQWGLK